MLASYEHHQNKQYPRIHRQTLRDKLDPFDIPDERFREMYRLSRCLALNFLDILQEYMVYDNKCPDIPLPIRFCAVLNFYATGTYQRRVGNDSFTCIRQTCVSRCIRSLSRIIGTQIINKITLKTKKNKKVLNQIGKQSSKMN